MDGNTPVIVGVAQVVERIGEREWQGRSAADAPAFDRRDHGLVRDQPGEAHRTLGRVDANYDERALRVAAQGESVTLGKNEGMMMVSVSGTAVVAD